MKQIIPMILCLGVAACCPPVKPDDPTSHELISKKIPPELLEIPAPVATPDLNGSQKDVALWLIENEKRTKSLENQLGKIKEYTTEKK